MADAHRSVYASRRPSVPPSPPAPTFSERTQNQHKPPQDEWGFPLSSSLRDSARTPRPVSASTPRPVSPTPRTPRDFVFPSPPLAPRFGGKPPVLEETLPLPPFTSRISNTASLYATATLPMIPHPPGTPTSKGPKLNVWSEEQVRELEEFREIARITTNVEVKKTLSSLYETTKDAYEEALKSGALDSDPFGPRHRKPFNFNHKDPSAQKPGTAKSVSPRKKRPAKAKLPDVVPAQQPSLSSSRAKDSVVLGKLRIESKAPSTQSDGRPSASQGEAAPSAVAAVDEPKSSGRDEPDPPALESPASDASGEIKGETAATADEDDDDFGDLGDADADADADDALADAAAAGETAPDNEDAEIFGALATDPTEIMPPMQREESFHSMGAKPAGGETEEDLDLGEASADTGAADKPADAEAAALGDALDMAFEEAFADATAAAAAPIVLDSSDQPDAKAVSYDLDLDVLAADESTAPADGSDASVADAPASTVSDAAPAAVDLKIEDDLGLLGDSTSGAIAAPSGEVTNSDPLDLRTDQPESAPAPTPVAGGDPVVQATPAASESASAGSTTATSDADSAADAASESQPPSGLDVSLSDLSPVGAHASAAAEASAMEPATDSTLPASGASASESATSPSEAQAAAVAPTVADSAGSPSDSASTRSDPASEPGESSSDSAVQPASESEPRTELAPANAVPDAEDGAAGAASVPEKSPGGTDVVAADSVASNAESAAPQSGSVSSTETVETPAVAAQSTDALPSSTAAAAGVAETSSASEDASEPSSQPTSAVSDGEQGEATGPPADASEAVVAASNEGQTPAADASSDRSAPQSSVDQAAQPSADQAAQPSAVDTACDDVLHVSEIVVSPSTDVADNGASRNEAPAPSFVVESAPTPDVTPSTAKPDSDRAAKPAAADDGGLSPSLTTTPIEWQDPTPRPIDPTPRPASARSAVADEPAKPTVQKGWSESPAANASEPEQAATSSDAQATAADDLNELSGLL